MVRVVKQAEAPSSDARCEPGRSAQYQSNTLHGTSFNSYRTTGPCPDLRGNLFLSMTAAMQGTRCCRSACKGSATGCPRRGAAQSWRGCSVVAGLLSRGGTAQSWRDCSVVAGLAARFRGRVALETD